MGKFTVDDLERAHTNRKKREQESQTATSARSVPSVQNGRYQYTVEDLERAHQNLYGENTQKVLDLAETRTPQEIAWNMLMEYNGRKNKPTVEQYDHLNPNSEHMQTYMRQNRVNEGTQSTPTSPWLIKTMDDAAIDEALNILKEKQTDAESRYLNTWNTDKQDDSIPAEINSYKETIGKYEEEKERRDAEQQVADSKAYQEKRNTTIEDLPEEAVELINQYNRSSQLYTNTQVLGSISGYVDQGELMQWEASMKDARDKLINDYGINESEIGKVLQYGKEVKDEADTQQMQQQIRDDVAEHPVGYGTFYSGLDLLMSPGAGLAAMEESVNTRNYADQDAPINTNSSAYAATNFSNATEQAVNEQIDNPAGQFIYNVGMSTGKSALSAALGGQVTGALGLTGKAASVVGNIVTLPQFGSSAYAATLQQDQAKGISRENATKHAAAAGIGEMLFEVASLDKIWEIAGRSGKATAKQVLKDTLVQAGIEGTEEGATDIFDRIADDIINGDLSDYNMSVSSYVEQGYSEEAARELASKDFYVEVAQDALAGMVSGGIMSGGANAVAYHNYTKLGKYVDTNTRLKDSVIEAASQMEEGTVARQLVEEKGTENIDAKDTGTILRSMAEEAQTDVSEIIEQRFIELGESRQQAKADAKEIMAAVTTPSEEVSEAENEARAAKFEQNENLATVYKETLEGEHTSASDVLRRAAESYEAEKAYQRMQRKNNKMSETHAIDTQTGDAVIVAKMEEITPKNATVRLSNGSVLNLSEVKIQDNTMQGLYNFASTMEDAKVANAVIEEYAGEPLHTYAESCAVFYNAGKLGTTAFEALLKNPKNARIVSNMKPATLKMMYEMGRNQAEQTKAKEQMRAAEQVKENSEVAPVQQKKEETEQKGEKQTEKKGEVIDNRIDRADNRIADVARQVAKKTGLTITLNDALENGENGHFSKALSRIALSSQSINEYATLVHELNEFAEAYNPAGMRQVMDTVLNYAETQEGAAYLSNIVQRYQDQYKRVEADKTYEGASEEFVFDYLAGIFSSEDGVRDFCRYMTDEEMTQQKQKSIIETITDFFKELFDRITSYLNDHTLSKTAERGLRADAQKAQEIRNMVLEVWQQAEEHFKEDILADIPVQKQFSLDADVEQTKDLVAVHNLREDNMERVLELGAFPMPSIAITKAELGHSDFGEISCVFRKDTIDPRNRKNKVYGADAWTPTFPRVEYEANNKVAREINDKINEYVARGIPDVYANRARAFVSGLEYNLDSYGGKQGLIERALGDYGMKAAYMGSRGETIEMRAKEVRTEMKDYEKEISRKLIDKFGSDISQMAKMAGRDLIANYNYDIRKTLEAYYVERGLDEEQAQNIVNSENKFAIIKQVRAAQNFLENGGVTITKDIDYKRMQEEIDQRIVEKEYTNWLETLFDGIVADYGLPNGKDPFTASGNRRSFQQTHIPYTVENIVKSMLAQTHDIRNTSGFNGIKSIRAEAVKEFKDIRSIKRASGKLNNIDTEEYEKLRENLDRRLETVIRDIVEQSATREQNQYISMDAVGNVILEACSNPTFENVKKTFASYIWKCTDIQAREIADIITAVRDMPVNMFEAKPTRVVGFEEVAAVLMPDNASTRIREKVSAAGLNIVEYEAGNEKSRLDALNSIDDVKFSLTVDEDGIENYNTSDDTRQLSYKERQRKLLDVMKNEYAGRTAKFTKDGQVYYALYDKKGLSKGVYGDKKSDDAGKKAKINIGADGNYIELAENALYSGSKEESGKPGKFHRNAKSWDYYVKTIKSDGIYYDVLINVKDTGNDKFVYDITLRRQKNKKSSPLINYDLQGGGTTSYKDSIAHNSENTTKKYSIDVDDALLGTMEDGYSAQEKEIASIVEEGFSSLQHVTVDEKLMRKIAHDIRKEYQSTYDMDKLTDNLTKVFAYLKDHTGSVGYEDMVRIVQEIAKPVLEESTDVDTYGKNAYDNFRNYLKKITIRLNEEQKAEVAYYFGSYEKFRKMNYGNINFADNGRYLDSVWDEICGNANQMLNHDTLSADKPIALIDALNAMKPAKKNIYGMDTEQAAYDLSLDIFRRFFVEQAEEKANKKVYEKANRLIERQQEYRKRVKREYDKSLVRLREVEKQKRQKLAEKYEQKIEEIDREMKSILAYNDAKAYTDAKKQREKYTKMLAEANRKADERILKIKAGNKQSWIKKKQTEENRKYRERIRKNASGIISYFNTNTDKKHVPEALKTPVAAFITSLDTASDRTNPESAAQLKWQDSLNELYRRLSSESAAVEGEYEDVYNALIDREKDGKNVSSLLEDMSAFIGANTGVRIVDMDVRQLKELNELITALKRAITTVNQLYVNKRTENVQKLGDASIAELSVKKDKTIHTNELVKMGDNLLNVSMLDARSFFHRLGESAESVYGGLRKGFSDRVWLLKEAQDYMQEVLGKTDIKTWTGAKAEVHTIIVQGKELRMTTAQIMSLYELSKRYQAKLHMTGAGIRPTDIRIPKRTVTDIRMHKEKVYHRVKPIQLTEYDIDQICSLLTPEQRQVADAMQQFMEERCADWGNKLTMQMYGYKRFGGKNYFPIRTDGNSVDTRDDTKYWAAKNAGFTKSTMKDARNALIVDDIFDVFTKHVSDMATYATFTAPLADAMKWFNYRNETDSVKTEIERVYGAEYLNYFKKLIQDINSEATKGIDSQISDHFVSRMKAASVGANLRVAVQQPTAYIRAASVMNTKYLIKGLNVVAAGKKHAIKKSRENSAITQWKSWGYFETSIGRSMKGIITGQQSLREKVVEKSMLMAQLGDDVTWGALWNACEAEIRDKHKEVAYDSKEFLELVSDRFDEVVDQTQVVDSVLHRSQIMRSTNGITQNATAFMAEPTKSYNLLMNAVRDAAESGKHTELRKLALKNLGRAVVAYTFTQTVNAAIVSIIDAMRDMDDDDDDFKTRYKESFKDNIKGNMNPLGLIPYVKDILSMIEGYDVARMDMQGLSNLLAGAQQIYKYVTDEEYREKHTAYTTFKTFIRGASQVMGIPAYNLMRDAESIWHTVTGDYMGGIKRADSRNYALMVEALLTDDEQQYKELEAEMKEKGETCLDITSGLSEEAKKRYTEGELSKEEATDFLVEDIGMSRDVAEEKVQSWKIGEVKEAFSDDGITQKQAIDRLAEETGMDKEEAKEEVYSWQIEELREDFMNGDVKKEKASEDLTEKYGMDENEAFFKVREWTYEKEHPGETCRKYTILHNAIDTANESRDEDDRDAIRDEIRTLKAHGVEEKDIVASVTKKYKEAFLEAKRNGDYADLQNLLISTYMFAGLSRDEAFEKINSWE